MACPSNVNSRLKSRSGPQPATMKTPAGGTGTSISLDKRRGWNVWVVTEKSDEE